MTIQSSGPIAFSNVSTEIGQAPTYTTSLSFLNSQIKPSVRPAIPNMSIFYGMSYFQNTTEGNCANGNCTADCNCGNIQCTNCYIAGTANCSNCYNCTASDCSNCQVCTSINCSVCSNCSPINCSNCDSRNYLQNNCNCACTYNCTQSAVNYNCNTSAVSYNCNQLGPVSYNCVTGEVSYACNCACNCSKIICAKLYDFGLMDQNIWAADQAYGQWLRKKDRRVYRGYVRWARIVTAWMDGKGPTYMPWILDADKRSQAQKAAITDMAIKIGTPWSEHMAYLMGALPEDNVQGRILMEIGKPICRFVDSLPRVSKRERRHRLPTLYTMWALFYLSYYTSLAGARIHSLFKGLSFGKLKQWVAK